jgi:hypothetical protein
MLKQIFLFLLAVILCAGCAGKRKKTDAAAPAAPTGTVGASAAPSSPKQKSKAPDTAKPIVTPESGLTGKVVSYNDDGRFAVLNFPIGHMPAAEQRLFAYRNGLKVGEIKIDRHWQLNELIVADLLTGEAQPGDEVRDK